MRRLLALALALTLAGAITATPRAAAGVDGDLDTFAAALDDLADQALDASAVLSKRPTARAGTGQLVIVLGDLRTTVARVAAAGLPVADHLSTGRLSPAHAADTLEPPVRSLAAAVQELVSVPDTISLGRGDERMTEEEEQQQQPSPVELLAPAIQALARTLETLEPALEALRPVVEPLAPVIAPVIDPVCGQVPGVVFLALGLAPTLAPVPLPTLPESPTVLAGSLLAPVFLLCASLPMPDEDAPADGDPGDGTPPDDASVGPAQAPPAPPAPGASPAPSASRPRLTGRGPVSSDPPRSPTPGATAVMDRAPGAQTETAAAATTGAAQPRLVTSVPLLPVDHDGEATGIALLVLAAAAVTAAVTVQVRRRRGLTDWAIPVAAGTGVGAVAAGAMAWNGAAEQLAPWAQIPYVISGGMTALVLGVVSITLAVAGPLARIAAAGR